MPDIHAVQLFSLDWESPTILTANIFTPDDAHINQGAYYAKESDSVFIGRAPQAHTDNDAKVDRGDNHRQQRTIPSNSWVLPCAVMSRSHAVLTFRGDKVLLRDVGSHHGTWRGETRLQSDTDHELKDGEIVTFGKEIEKHGQVHYPARVQIKFIHEGEDEEPLSQLLSASDANAQGRLGSTKSNRYGLDSADDMDIEYSDDDGEYATTPAMLGPTTPPDLEGSFAANFEWKCDSARANTRASPDPFHWTNDDDRELDTIGNSSSSSSLPRPDNLPPHDWHTNVHHLPIWRLAESFHSHPSAASSSHVERPTTLQQILANPTAAVPSDEGRHLRQLAFDRNVLRAPRPSPLPAPRAWRFRPLDSGAGACGAITQAIRVPERDAAAPEGHNVHNPPCLTQSQSQFSARGSSDAPYALQLRDGARKERDAQTLLELRNLEMLSAMRARTALGPMQLQGLTTTTMTPPAADATEAAAAVAGRATGTRTLAGDLRTPPSPRSIYLRAQARSYLTLPSVQPGTCSPEYMPSLTRPITGTHYYSLPPTPDPVVIDVDAVSASTAPARDAQPPKPKEVHVISSDESSRQSSEGVHGVGSGSEDASGSEDDDEDDEEYDDDEEDEDEDEDEDEVDDSPKRAPLIPDALRVASEYPSGDIHSRAMSPKVGLGHLRHLWPTEASDYDWSDWTDRPEEGVKPEVTKATDPSATVQVVGLGDTLPPANPVDLLVIGDDEPSVSVENHSRKRSIDEVEPDAKQPDATAATPYTPEHDEVDELKGHEHTDIDIHTSRKDVSVRTAPMSMADAPSPSKRARVDMVVGQAAGVLAGAVAGSILTWAGLAYM